MHIYVYRQFEPINNANTLATENCKDCKKKRSAEPGRWPVPVKRHWLTYSVSHSLTLLTVSSVTTVTLHCCTVALSCLLILLFCFPLHFSFKQRGWSSLALLDLFFVSLEESLHSTAPLASPPPTLFNDRLIGNLGLFRGTWRSGVAKR